MPILIKLWLSALVFCFAVGGFRAGQSTNYPIAAVRLSYACGELAAYRYANLKGVAIPVPPVGRGCAEFDALAEGK